MSNWHPARLLARKPLCRRSVETTMRCEQCGEVRRVKRCVAATAYVNPALNRSNYFCERCAEDYYEYWADMWSNVYY
jgi:hypothetical protein